MMVSGAMLHSLPAGYRFDLRARALLPWVETPSARRARAKDLAAKRLKRLAEDAAGERAAGFVIEPRRGARREELEASE
jgi:hypothetical protein